MATAGLFFALTAGGVALGGVAESSDGTVVQPLRGPTSATSTATAPVSSAADSTSAVTLPTPEPQIAPLPTRAADPVDKIVGTVTSTAAAAVSTVSGLLTPPAPPGDGPKGSSGGSTPSVPSTHPAHRGTTQPHRRTVVAPASESRTAGLGRIPDADLGTHDNTTVTAASQPQLTPNVYGPPDTTAHNSRSLPAALVVVAVVAFAVVAASHIGVIRNRMRVAAA